jgi:hypothetical protein
MIPFVALLMWMILVLTSNPIFGFSRDPFLLTNSKNSIARILYGSCHSTQLKSPLWPLIVGRNPHVWIFGGDNVYADQMLRDPLYALTRFQLPFMQANETRLRQVYKELYEDEWYQLLLNTKVDQIAIWDDHDYGISKFCKGNHNRKPMLGSC